MDIYVNHIYGGEEGYYSPNGSAGKMSPAYEQYRWRVLEDGVVYRLHAVCWIIAEDESLIAYKSNPAANRDTYIVGGVDARYIQYQSGSVSVSEYGAGKLLVCYGDSITDGSVTNIGYPFFVPRVSDYGTINLGSSGGTAERIRHIATGEGDGGGTYTDISKYVNGGFVAGIVLMSGLNNTTAPTATNALTIEWLMARYPHTRIILAKYHYVSNPGTGKTTTAQMLRCDESVDELAERYGLGVWSPRDCWGADNADQYLADAVHPNNTGAELIARSLASYLAANTEEPGETYYETYRRSGERVMIPATRVLYNRYGQQIEPIVP